MDGRRTYLHPWVERKSTGLVEIFFSTEYNFVFSNSELYVLFLRLLAIARRKEVHATAVIVGLAAPLCGSALQFKTLF
jgi:hypothetical protein